MSNVEIRDVSEQDLRSKPYEAIGGDGNWDRFMSDGGRTTFKSRAGVVKSIKATCAHYAHQSFVAYVGIIGDSWYAFYKVAA